MTNTHKIRMIDYKLYDIKLLVCNTKAESELYKLF